MDFFSIVLFAVGMSLDDFALALSLSLLYNPPTIRVRILYACKMAITFSISTGLLPVIGWLVGIGIYKWVAPFEAWVVLAVFCGVGGWTIKEAFEKEDKGLEKKNIGSFWVLMVIGILGSLDEGAAGIGFAFLDTPILVIILSIIVVNTIFVIIATMISSHMPTAYQKVMKISAGVLLIALGIINCIELL